MKSLRLSPFKVISLQLIKNRVMLKNKTFKDKDVQKMYDLLRNDLNKKEKSLISLQKILSETLKELQKRKK